MVEKMDNLKDEMEAVSSVEMMVEMTGTEMAGRTACE